MCWLATFPSGLQYCSCKTNTLSQIFHRAQSGGDSGESRSRTQVRAIHILTTLSSVFSHGPMLDHKALVAPDPTYSGSLSCKSLLVSHCAVFQTTVSSNDCAINTSMNGCYPYVASIYVRLSNVTIHPYLHCGGNWFFVVIYSCHKTPSLKYQQFSLIFIGVCVCVRVNSQYI